MAPLAPGNPFHRDTNGDHPVLEDEGALLGIELFPCHGDIAGLFDPGRWICGSDEEQRTAFSVTVEWLSPDEVVAHATGRSSFPDGTIGLASYPVLMRESGGVWEVRGQPPEGFFPRGVLRMGSHCDGGDQGIQHPPG